MTLIDKAMLLHKDILKTVPVITLQHNRQLEEQTGTQQSFDVLPTRKLPRLTSYFIGCTNPKEIKFLVTDRNAAYFQLTKRVLPMRK